MKPDNANLVFDPSLQPVFSAMPGKQEPFAVKNSRELFYTLVHISEHYPVLPAAYRYLKGHFQQAGEQLATPAGNKFQPGDLEKLLAVESFQPLSEPSGTCLNDCLVQFAPVFFTAPAWLAAISQTVTCQAPLAVDLMAMSLRLARDGQNMANVRAAYTGALLASPGIEIPALHTFAFATQPDVGDEIFDFAAIQLALAQFPRVFFPEILGFTLAYCHSASLPERFFHSGEAGQLPGFLVLRNRRRRQELPAIKAAVLAYLQEFKSQSDVLWQRIQTGFRLYRLQTENCNQCISVHLQSEMSPRQAMHKLLNSLIPHAIGHHGNIRLGGKTIDEWFKETPFKSDNFLAALLYSPLVDRAKPENSKLVKLYEFGGPMFGVLDEKAKGVLKNWLLSELNPEKTHPKKTQINTLKSRSYAYGLKKIPHEPVRIEGLFEAEKAGSTPVVRENFSSAGNNRLFFYLINSDVYLDVLPAAESKVHSVLRRARLFSRLPFRRYSHDLFKSYIESIYQKETARYKPIIKQPKLSKAVYVWGIEQFAPAILTDGSWLQNIRQLAYYPVHAVGGLLEKIYEDEIGNGIREQNHPYIYRDLLDSLNINLPPVHSEDFVVHPGFISGAFDIPVYLMAIAKFPSAFLPELLGLNMAIELSGLGNQYLRLSQALRYWGINPAIVEVHTSIDNLASGHSALAMKAIQLYLDEIAANSGAQAVDRHWRRIYTGFRSLPTAGTRFKFSLIWQYFLKKPEVRNAHHKAR